MTHSRTAGWAGVLAVVLTCVGAALAEERTDRPVNVTVLWENDSSFVAPFNPNDRYYTNGIKLTVAWKPDGLTPLLAALPFNPAGDGQTQGLETAFGVSAGQSIFTPDDFSVAELQVDDRPYAGWLYGGVHVQRATDDVLDHVELNVGVIGQASLADETQTTIHRIFDQDEPQGWGNQLGNELGFNVTMQRKWKLPIAGEPGDGGAIELLPQAGFTVGTINRELNAAITARAGWNLPYDFGPARIAEPAAATHIHRKPVSPGVYVFGRFGGRVVEHNTFLEGNNFRDSHGVDINHLVGEMEAGVVGQISFFGPDTFRIGWSHTIVTEQFESQRGEHHFGAWKLNWTLLF